MITLKTLTWSNAFSYGENNILELSDKKITQILGSNGVGKSSIPLIIEEVLFNKNSKGIKKADVANRAINKGYYINLKFSKDLDEYEIDLNRKSSLKVKLTKNGEDISSHTATNTYKTIEAILGLDFKTFTQIVYQNTNTSLNFLTATDSNRKKFLIDLLGLERYTALFEVFKSASREVESEYSRVEGKISTIQKWVETNQLADTSKKDFLEVPNVSEQEQKELTSLLVELKNISTTNRKITQNNQYKEMLKSINIEKIREIPVNELKSYDSAQEELGDANSLIRLAKASIEKMGGLNNECPTCEQTITEEFKERHIREEREKLQQQEERKTALEKEIKEIQEDNAQYRLKQSKIKEWEEIFSNIDRTLQSELVDENDLLQKVDSLKASISAKSKQVEQVQRKNQEISSHNTRIDVILEQAKEFEAQLNELQESFDTVHYKKSNLEILKKAFSTNGLVAYKIENLVKELEELTSEYLAELSDGRFTLNFSVNNDKLNVDITDNGKVIDILALSSGELARVNTATLLGIRKVMNSLSSSRINVLFLDEVINVLDEQGRERLVEVLLKEDLNTYIVSHQWSHPLLEKVEVRKEGGISKLW